MTLIDRYLRAVRSNLPRAQQDDIIEELSENLHAQFEDEEAARGRPLLDTEQAAILKRFGNPLVVAARYRGDHRSVTFGRQLIGPELFPFYAKVLAINVAITLAVGLVILLVSGGSIWSAIYGVAVPLVFQFVIVTAVFVAIDRRFASDPGPLGSANRGFELGRRGLRDVSTESPSRSSASPTGTASRTRRRPWSSVS